jgi:NAD(P)-dependent dehydrogenase (short-subunit alcohol dehydrogenase family)
VAAARGVRAVDAPEATVVEKETIELAFLAAIQHLPARQRAATVLRDLLGWSASETAQTLGMSVAAVKSALQRARPVLQERLPRRRLDWAPGAQPTTARAPSAGMGNTGPADAAVELLMRTLALELGPSGVRVVGIYTAETPTSEPVAQVSGRQLDVDAILAGVAQMTALRRARARPRGRDGGVLASDRAGDITGTIVDVSCGLVPG